MAPISPIEFVRLVIGGDTERVSQLLSERSDLAMLALPASTSKAKSSDKDAKGKSVTQAAISEWVRELLAGYASSGM